MLYTGIGSAKLRGMSITVISLVDDTFEVDFSAVEEFRMDQAPTKEIDKRVEAYLLQLAMQEVR